MLIEAVQGRFKNGLFQISRNAIYNKFLYVADGTQDHRVIGEEESWWDSEN